MKNVIPKILVGVISILIVLSMSFVVLSPGNCNWIVRYAGYWILCGLFVGFAFVCYSEIRQKSAASELVRNKYNLIAFVLSLGVVAFFHARESPELRILFDEHVINMTAKELHEERDAAAPKLVHRLDNKLRAFSGRVDKRPIFFPFVLSLVHSTIGYRMENVFLLNSVLTFSFLFGVYFLVSKMTHPRLGLFSVLLLATSPLLAENCTGGGYEVMNLVLIVLLMILSIRYLETKGSKHLNLLILTALLLANTRYESMLYLVVPVLLLLFKSVGEKHISLTWFSVLSPLFAILPLASNRVFQSDDSFWHNRKDDFFGLQHLYDNLPSAVGYLFDFEGQYNNSLAISFLGVVSSVFVLILILKLFRTKKDPFNHNASQVVFYLFGGIICLLTFLMLSHYWGKWTDPMTSRFSLPLHLLWVVSIPFVVFYGFRRKEIGNWICLAPIVYLICFAGVSYGDRFAKREIIIQVAYDWAIQYAEEHFDKQRCFVAATGPGGFLLKKFAAGSTGRLNSAPERMFKLKELGIYEEIYVLQYLWLDIEGDVRKDVSMVPLSPRVELEKVEDFRLRTNVVFRFSKVVGIKENSSEFGKWNTTEVNQLPELPPEGYSKFDYRDYVYELCRSY